MEYTQGIEKKDMYWGRGFESHNAALDHRFSTCYCSIPIAFQQD
jgi:hypothetical protein